jgi:hypothetical protein
MEDFFILAGPSQSNKIHCISSTNMHLGNTRESKTDKMNKVVLSYWRLFLGIGKSVGWIFTPRDFSLTILELERSKSGFSPLALDVWDASSIQRAKLKWWRFLKVRYPVNNVLSWYHGPLRRFLWLSKKSSFWH